MTPRLSRNTSSAHGPSDRGRPGWFLTQGWICLVALAMLVPGVLRLHWSDSLLWRWFRVVLSPHEDLACVVGFYGFFFIVMHASVRRLWLVWVARRSGYRLCKRCHYTLRSDIEAGVCPECGAKYTLDSLRWFWSVPPAQRLIARIVAWNHTRSIARSDGRLCPNCSRDLLGYGDSGQCPSCGTPFEVTALRRHWRRERR